MVGCYSRLNNKKINYTHVKNKCICKNAVLYTNSMYSCDSLSLRIKMTLIYYAFLKQWACLQFCTWRVCLGWGCMGQGGLNFLTYQADKCLLIWIWVMYSFWSEGQFIYWSVDVSIPPFLKQPTRGPVVACLRGGSASNVSIPGGIRKEKHNYAI